VIHANYTNAEGCSHQGIGGVSAGCKQIYADLAAYGRFGGYGTKARFLERSWRGKGVLEGEEVCQSAEEEEWQHALGDAFSFDTDRDEIVFAVTIIIQVHCPHDGPKVFSEPLFVATAYHGKMEP